MHPTEAFMIVFAVGVRQMNSGWVNGNYVELLGSTIIFALLSAILFLVCLLMKNLYSFHKPSAVFLTVMFIYPAIFSQQQEKKYFDDTSDYHHPFIG